MHSSLQHEQLFSTTIFLLVYPFSQMPKSIHLKQQMIAGSNPVK
jgi:hypothetical protein